MFSVFTELSFINIKKELATEMKVCPSAAPYNKLHVLGLKTFESHCERKYC